MKWNCINFNHHTLVKIFFTCLKRVFGGSNLLLGVILTSNYQKDILIGFGVPKSIHYDIISKSNHFIFSFEKILYKIYFFDPWDKNKMHKVLTPGFSCKVIPWKTNKTKKSIYTLIPYETCFLWQMKLNYYTNMWILEII